MQKKFALVIVISLCLLLTACGGNTNAPSDTISSNMADSTEIPDAAENDTDIQTEDKPTSESANVIKLKFLPNTKKHPPRLI